MSASLENVSAWFHRAERFVRRLNQLPGQWGISVSVEPPVDCSEFDSMAGGFAYKVPPLLRRLYTEGSAKFQCRYHWRPDAKHLPEANALFPHQYTFYGGPEF